MGRAPHKPFDKEINENSYEITTHTKERTTYVLMYRIQIKASQAAQTPATSTTTTTTTPRALSSVSCHLTTLASLVSLRVYARRHQDGVTSRWLDRVRRLLERFARHDTIDVWKGGTNSLVPTYFTTRNNSKQKMTTDQ